MSEMSTHELVAPYALNSLDEDERRDFERHLDECEQCQEVLPSLLDAAAAMAYAPGPAEPAPELRDRIVASARRGGEVMPFRRRALPALSVVAVAAASAAVGLGIWALSLHGSLSRERDARARDDAALAVLSDPAARRIPLSGRSGVLALRRDGTAALAVEHLGRAPSGKTYEAWVIGRTARPAGLFRGESATTLALLRLKVGGGAAVAVTVERAGGVSKPTSKPILSAAT